MNGEISYRDQNCFLYQAVNMFISAVKHGDLWRLTHFWSQPQVDKKRNCSFWLHWLHVHHDPRSGRGFRLLNCHQVFVHGGNRWVSLNHTQKTVHADPPWSPF
ncbi:hypothetical protein D9C73_007175 [Collichthys lucidus]|uniref:Uncharacterized protein n=1 Tax=Collichthys lucidus TaxID=240159 RepID=A0A4U5UEU0_COLLU|nr:hypothetical protein D9C73_007175 [Collichthys lucidus]